MKHNHLFCQTLGQGPDLIMLHGWGLHGGIWQLAAEQLASDYRVHLIDLPGFGRSELTAPFSLQHMVQQVMDVMPEQAILLGWSMGGLVAQQIAMQQPQRVSALINVATSPCFMNRDDWQVGLKSHILGDFSNALAQDYVATLQRFLAIQTIGSEHAKLDIKLLKQQLFLHGEPHQQALTKGLQLLHDVDLRSTLSDIQCPTTWLYGRLDSLVPVASAAQIKQLMPKAQQHIFSKASHAPFISHRAEFVDVVQQFLAQSL